jgi:hypothetical protein
MAKLAWYDWIRAGRIDPISRAGNVWEKMKFPPDAWAHRWFGEDR